MNIRTGIFVLGLILLSETVVAFPCYFTFAKDSCWLKYNVSVDVIEASTTNKILTLNIPAGTPWVREKFECVPAQGFYYVAKFSPVFWKGEEGKTYRGLRNWSLPGSINPGDSAWDIPVCFPKHFAEVPLPPDANNQCYCDFKVIPDIKPAVIK